MATQDGGVILCRYGELFLKSGNRRRFERVLCDNIRAAVAGFVTSASIPAGVPAEYVQFLPKPMPPEIANHVAAVTLFGKPSAAWLQNYGAPAIVIGPLYVPKTIDLCAAGDTICNGDPGGAPNFAHAEYPANGMTAQAADFAASHL